jgi:hypothetical protein
LLRSKTNLFLFELQFQFGFLGIVRNQVFRFSKTQSLLSHKQPSIVGLSVSVGAGIMETGNYEFLWNVFYSPFQSSLKIISGWRMFSSLCSPSELGERYTSLSNPRELLPSIQSSIDPSLSIIECIT